MMKGSGAFTSILISNQITIKKPCHLCQTSLHEVDRVGGLVAWREELDKICKEGRQMSNIRGPCKIGGLGNLCLIVGSYNCELLVFFQKRYDIVCPSILLN